LNSLKRTIIKVGVLNVIAVLILFISFVSLGFWQLNRAGDMKAASNIRPDSAPVAIESIAKPNSNLTDMAVNKLVKLNGRYVKSYEALNQSAEVDGRKVREDLEVRLMKLDSGSGILVVRGPSKMNEQTMPDEIEVMGRLLPRESEDVAKPGLNTLTRIDPSVITSDTNLNLIDGYVVAIDERTRLGERIWNDRISADVKVPKVAGFYWQHLTYVGIWWLFALLVLIAPFYEELRDRKVRVG
jgi:cytochrome oxidase assembly protein ShyY1